MSLSSLQSEVAILTLKPDHIVMPPVTRSQYRRPYTQSTIAPFPSREMSQRYSTSRLSSLRQSVPAQARYATRRSGVLQSQEVISSDDGTEAESDSSDDSNASDNEGTGETTAERNRRIAKMVRHLTLTIAPEPVEDFASDASQALPHAPSRRTDESQEFLRVVDILISLSVRDDRIRTSLLENSALQLSSARWGESMLRRFLKSFHLIKDRFEAYKNGQGHYDSDTINTGNALRNWMAGLCYIIPDRMQHMSRQTQGYFVDLILHAIRFVVQEYVDVRNRRQGTPTPTPDYASQTPTQNVLYNNVIANGRNESFGLPLLARLRSAISTDAQIQTILQLHDTIVQRHMVGGSSSGPRPSAQFMTYLGQLKTYVTSLS